MSELIDLTKVFILESPSFADILENRKEGDALSKILNLATIKNKVLCVSDEETLTAALDIIANEVNEIKKELGAVYIHFSLHGSEDGIELSNKYFLNLEALFKHIKKFNDKIDYLQTNGYNCSPTFLVFSVCKGYFAKAIKEFDEENFTTYTGLVGPTESVTWSDSLLAYSIFYHNTIIKQTGLIKALENMNGTVGLDDVFKADPGTGMELV